MHQSYIVREGRLVTPPPCQPRYGYPSHGDLQKHGEYAIHHPTAGVDWQVYLEWGNFFREAGNWYADLGRDGRARVRPETTVALEVLVATIATVEQ